LNHRYTNNRLSLYFLITFIAGLFSIPACAQTLSVTTPTPNVTIHPGDANVPLMVSLGSSTYSGPVAVTLTNLPSGITVTPVTLTPGSTGTIFLTAAVSTDQEGFNYYDFSTNTAFSTVNLFAFSGSLSASSPVSLTVSLQNPTFQPAAGKINLPILSINTNGLGIVDGTTDVPGTITITSADGTITYLPGLLGSDNTATFHIHGNTTAVMPKKPYHVKLNTSVDLLNGMGLNCGYVTSASVPTCDKSKSYILLANYDDKTLLRDWAASALANAIPNGGDYLSAAGAPSPGGTSAFWAPHSLFVELYLNGEYEGNYQLIEEVKIDSHRVNINEMGDTDISGKSLTGGYLMDIDDHEDEDFIFFTPHGYPVGLTDPDFAPEVPEQTGYITSYVDTAESALLSPTYTDPATGWRAYFDETAAVNYYIVNDVMSNADSSVFYSSTYLYKDKNNPLIYMGPIWDFDISTGNVYPGSASLDPAAPWMQNQTAWYSQWFSDPSFKTAAQQQWNALKNNGVLDNWLASIAQQSATLEQSQQNNFGRWPMQGMLVWPNATAVGSYDGEVNYMLNWIRLRMGYIDGFLNNKAPSSITMTTSGPTPLRAGLPITFNAKVAGNHPTGRVTFSRDSVVIGFALLDGTGAATLTTSDLAPGQYFLEAYYNGDDNNAITGILGNEVIVYPPLAPSTTNLTSSSSSINFGDSDTLTATVVAQSGATAPTGSVGFSANGLSLGSAPLSAGVATLVTKTIPVGSTPILATYTGDITYLQSTSNGLSVSVQTLPPNLAFVAIPSHAFGDAAFTVSATSSSSGAITYSVVSGPATLVGNTVTLTGAGTVVLAASQAADGNYAAANVQAIFNVAKQAATLALSASSGSLNPGASLTLTATASPAITGSTTGSVTFLSDGTPLGSAVALNGGIATLTTTALLSGTHAIVASYSGDMNFQAVVSKGVSVTIAPLDFTFAVTGAASQSIPAGAVATFTFQIAPLYGTYPDNVSFTLSGLPAGATAAFSPSTLNANSGSTTVTLTLQTSTQVATGRLSPSLAPFAFAFLLLPLAGTRRIRNLGSRIGTLTVILVGALALTALSGCGSSQPTSHDYPLTITATSGATQHTSSVTLTVH